MKNVTISLDEETARWARLEAARQDTSVSRLVGNLLREHMLHEARYDRAMTAYLTRPSRAIRDSDARYPSRDALHERA